jgi:peptidoglycan hydrolase CwlO-like protein
MDVVKELLEGKIDPPNEFVTYLRDQANGLRTRFGELDGFVMKARKELEAAEAEKHQLQGAHNKAIADLKHWAEKAAEGNGKVRELGKGPKKGASS